MFLGTNYCIPKRWPMGPFSTVCAPWLKPLVMPLVEVVYISRKCIPV